MDALIIIAILFISGLCLYIGYKLFFFKKETTPRVNVEDYAREYSEAEKEVLALINGYRITKNLKSLTFNDYISHHCEVHVNYCISKSQISHDNFPQRSSEIYNGLKATGVGEVVGYGYKTAEGVLNAWKKSPGHNEILINPKFNKIGIDLKTIGYKTYVVAILATV